MKLPKLKQLASFFSSQPAETLIPSYQRQIVFDAIQELYQSAKDSNTADDLIGSIKQTLEAYIWKK